MSLSERQRRYHTSQKGRAVAARAQKRHRDKKRDRIRALARERGCADCGGRAALQWHHLDPSTKRRGVTSLTGYGWSVIEAEMAKCVVLCRPCHLARHGRKAA